MHIFAGTRSRADLSRRSLGEGGRSFPRENLPPRGARRHYPYRVMKRVLCEAPVDVVRGMSLHTIAERDRVSGERLKGRCCRALGSGAGAIRFCKYVHGDDRSRTTRRRPVPVRG
jgi:hypothetical protein